MACTRPLKAYWGPNGTVVFNPKDGFYDRPLELRCRQCSSCRLARSRDWAIRATHEAELNDRNSFITLTYDQEHLPDDLSLNVKHWQNFAKRLRKKLGPFRFMHCGEYGEENKRPHYHALLFGIDFSHDRVPFKGSGKDQLWTSPTLCKLWPYGFSSIGSLTFDSAGYVARYAMKKISGPKEKKERPYERVDAITGETWVVKKEYATMSLKPGLGAKWFARFKGDLYPDDFVIAKGQQFPVPEYYDDLLATDDPALYRKVINRRRKKAEEDKENTTPERLRVREKVLDAQLKQKSRKI